MKDTYTIEWNAELEMYTMSVNGNAMMKNTKKSTLAKKLSSWLASQGQ